MRSGSAAVLAAPPQGQVDPDALQGQCAGEALAVTVQYGPQGAGAGQRHSSVSLANNGTESCVLAGVPGVSVVGHGDGTEIGQPADHPQEPGGSAEVQVPPAGSAHASLASAYLDESRGAYGPRCQAEKADGYRVYPPHGFRAFFVEARGAYACTADVVTMHIGSAEAG